MRLAICTPWSGQSSTAGCNLLVARELRSRGVNLAILRSEAGSAAADAALSDEFPVLPPGIATPAWLAEQFDAVLYAIGDDFPRHADALRLLELHPGIVLLRDAHLVGLFESWARETGQELRLAEIRDWLYGRQPPAQASLDWLVGNQPLLEWPAFLGTGALVHAEHDAARVRSACCGPVAIAPRCTPPGYVDVLLPLIERSVADAALGATLRRVHELTRSLGLGLHDASTRRLIDRAGTLMERGAGPGPQNRSARTRSVPNGEG